MNARIVLLGPPAAGKGTQAALLSRELSIPHSSTGAMLREEKMKGTELGKKAAEWTNHGRLVPDELVMQIVGKWLDSHASSFLFDGFPRTASQAQAFDLELARRDSSVDIAFLLDLSEEEIRRRVLDRITCNACGATFSASHDNVGTGDPCLRCGATLIRRDDDSPEALAVRLRQYHELTVPVASFYESKNLLLRVDASLGRNELFHYLRDSIRSEAQP